jgi:hypothetical protein
MGAYVTEAQLEAIGTVIGNKVKAKIDASGIGGTLSGPATVTLPGMRGVFEWTETVPAAGVVPANSIMAALAPALDTDENDPEFLALSSLVALAGTNAITFKLAFSEATAGPIKLNWKVI